MQLRALKRRLADEDDPWIPAAAQRGPAAALMPPPASRSTTPASTSPPRTWSSSR